MSAKLEVYQSPVDDQWYWRLKSPNGRIVCHGEGHTRKNDAYRAIDGVMRLLPQAEVREVTDERTR